MVVCGTSRGNAVLQTLAVVGCEVGIQAPVTWNYTTFEGKITITAASGNNFAVRNYSRSSQRGATIAAAAWLEYLAKATRKGAGL
jgi:hypothetical protein